MNELLTAKDVEVKVFKKSRFGGYSVPEVEDFLNQVADDLESYALQLDEKDARIQELEGYVKKQENMTDAIKDALIQARKSAKDMEDQAQSEKDKILADARAEAAKIISEAEAKVQAAVDEAESKAADMLADARAEAADIVQSSRDKKAYAEQSIAGIEEELAARRHAAENEAEDILASARSEARKMMIDAQKQAAHHEEQMQFLSLRKQQFLKDTVSLLLDFGRIIDKAQEEADEYPQPVDAEIEQPESTQAAATGAEEQANTLNANNSEQA